MTDNAWKPHGFKIKIQGVPYDPVTALRNFVLPVKHNPSWIEDSKPVTNSGLSSREWFGLALHAISLSDKTGDEFQIATENTGGDGALVRKESGEGFAVLVEQTLVTYKEEGDLFEVLSRRIKTKSSKGKNYTENKHLVMVCNKQGDLKEAVLAKLVAENLFGVVNVIAFQDNEQGRHYLSFVFDSDYSDKAVHKCAISEPNLWQSAIDLYDKQQIGKK